MISLEALAAQGISRRALDIWQAEGIEALTPLQAAAVADHGVLQGRSAIILAPTSAGKTLIAELAALRHLAQGRRTIFLVPTKALAEERGAEFGRRFGALGARVVVATRERPEADARIAEGNWDILVAIYEKVRAYLVARPALFAEVGLVVADEMQMLGELHRGDSVELILTKMAQRPERDLQFLGLSAVLGEPERLGAWLGCEVITWRERPVELREGVLCAEDGLFRHRLINAQRSEEEQIFEAELPSDDPEALLRETARALVEERGESTLIFAPTKRLTRDWAAMLAESLALSPCERALEQLEAMERSRDRTELRGMLAAGVAYHNADLPWVLRGVIERAYDAGEIRVLLATSTLAQGVNLTGRNVIVWPQQIATDRWTGEVITASLTRSRFQNAGGRAGRFGREGAFGRAILLAGSHDEAERLRDMHIGKPAEALPPGMASADLAPLVMDLVASGTATRPSEVEGFLLSTHTGITIWRSAERAQWDDRWLPCIERLERAHLLRRDEEGSLEPTGVGREMARSGVGMATALLFQRWLAAMEGPPTPLEALWCICRSRDGAEMSVPLWANERRTQALVHRMRELLADAAHPMSLQWLQPNGGLSERDLAAMKRALVLWSWLGEEETETIEERFGIGAGAVENAASHAAWLLESLANMATALGHADAVVASWRKSVRRLPLGLPENGIAWAGHRRRGVGRAHVRALVAEGFNAPEDLMGVTRETLARLVPEAVIPSLMGEPQPVVNQLPVPDRKPTPPGELPHVEAETGSVQWLGSEVRLPRMPARLLGLLAMRAPQAVSYREIEDTLWGPDCIVERQQISAHLRRALRALRAIDAKRADALVEVRTGQGLRMVGGGVTGA